MSGVGIFTDFSTLGMNHSNSGSTFPVFGLSTFNNGAVVGLELYSN